MFHKFIFMFFIFRVLNVKSDDVAAQETNLKTFTELEKDIIDELKNINSIRTSKELQSVQRSFYSDTEVKNCFRLHLNTSTHLFCIRFLLDDIKPDNQIPTPYLEVNGTSLNTTANKGPKLTTPNGVTRTMTCYEFSEMKHIEICVIIDHYGSKEYYPGNPTFLEPEILLCFSLGFLNYLTVPEGCISESGGWIRDYMYLPHEIKKP